MAKIKDKQTNNSTVNTTKKAKQSFHYLTFIND